MVINLKVQNVIQYKCDSDTTGLDYWHVFIVKSTIIVQCLVHIPILWPIIKMSFGYKYVFYENSHAET